MLVDVHAHINLIDKEEKGGIINRIIKNKIVVINNGLNPKTNDETIDLSNRYRNIKAALGIYPGDVLKMKDSEVDDEIERIKEIASKNKDIVAIGEIGLDYKEIGEDKEKDIIKEKRYFRRFLEMANELKKPVIIHSRKAEEDVIEILESYNINVIMHCFMGKLKLIDRIVDNGWFLSIPPVVVRLEHFQKVVGMVDISHLLTETDTPFLSPEKGKINEPLNVIYTIRKIADIKGLTEKETENNIFLNFRRLFPDILFN